MHACGKQKVTPQSAHFSGSLLVSKENIPGQRCFSFLLFFSHSRSFNLHSRRISFVFAQFVVYLW